MLRSFHVPRECRVSSILLETDSCANRAQRRMHHRSATMTGSVLEAVPHQQEHLDSTTSGGCTLCRTLRQAPDALQADETRTTPRRRWSGRVSTLRIALSSLLFRLNVRLSRPLRLPSASSSPQHHQPRQSLFPSSPELLHLLTISTRFRLLFHPPTSSVSLLLGTPPHERGREAGWSIK